MKSKTALHNKKRLLPGNTMDARFIIFSIAIAVTVVASTTAVYQPTLVKENVTEFVENIHIKNETERAEYLRRWHNERVNVAIMGNAAVGKSSFINKIRAVSKGEAAYAKVGVGGTTTVPIRYAMPDNAKIVFWDTPGLDTPDFQLEESLLESWGVDEYDYILIFYATSFHMSEIKITKMLKARGKNVAFVRTKIDELLHEDHDLELTDNIQKIKMEGHIILRKQGIGNDVRLFAISSLMRDLGDYEELLDHLLNSLPILKSKSMLLSMENSSKNIINRKTTNSLNEVWQICLLVGTVNGVPLPFIDDLIDVMSSEVLAYYIRTYVQSLKLDPASFNKLDKKIKSELKLSGAISDIGVTAFLTKRFGQVLSKMAYKVVGKKVAERVGKMIPVIGPIISGSVTYGICYTFLESLIKGLSDEALLVFNHTIHEDLKRINDITETKFEL